MKGLKKIIVFSMAVSSIMAVSATSAFAHHGGGHGGCRGGGYGYNYYAQSSYSCPYGNYTCNQQGYCIDHNAQYYQYANPNVYAQPANQPVPAQPATTQPAQQEVAQPIDTAPAQPLQANTEQPDTQAIINSDVPIENRASVEAELKKILEANKTIEAANAAIANQTATQPTQPSTYVCPNGNPICNQYGYCINNGYCGGYGCGGYGCGYNYGGYLN